MRPTRIGTSGGTHHSGGGLTTTVPFGGIHYRGDHVRAGIYHGARGLTAYYYRDRDHHGHHGHHNEGRHHYGVSYHGEFYGGLYYPYGYLSHHDVYYYRYPYHYVRTYDYYPIWTVYVEPAETVYVESPAQAVGDAGASDARPVIDGQIQVEPQQRIPVNNALLADAERWFRDGHYEEARAYFVRAVLNDPRNGFAELAYGLGHFAVGDYEAAGRAIRRGLALAPDVVDQPINVIRQYGDFESFERHLEALQRHLEAHPDHQDGWFLMGYLHYSSGKPVEALGALNKAWALDPQDTYAAVLRDSAKRVSTVP